MLTPHVPRLSDNGPLMENIYSADTSRSAIEQDVVLHCRSGGSYDVHYSITPLSTLDCSNIGSVLVIQDVTESRKMLRQLSYIASHDALTHLANRASFEKQLRILLQTVNSTHQRHALVFIDLDRFKAVTERRQLRRALQYYAVKYSGRQQYRLGTGDSGRYRITQNAAQAELQRLP